MRLFGRLMDKPPHHKNLSDYTLNHIYQTDLLSAYFYGNIVVVEAIEGVTISFKTGFSILLAGLRIVGNKPFVYISHRINSYAVNPTDYKYLNQIPNMKGLSIVAQSNEHIKNAEMEASFCRKPLAIFPSLEEAFGWAESMVATPKE